MERLQGGGESLIYRWEPDWLEHLKPEVFVPAVVSMHAGGRFRRGGGTADFATALATPLSPSLHEVALVAFYRSTRKASLWRLAETADELLIQAYEWPVRKAAWEHTPEGRKGPQWGMGQSRFGQTKDPVAEDVLEHAWLAFFEAVDRFEPYKRNDAHGAGLQVNAEARPARLMTYASLVMKGMLIKRQFDELSHTFNDDVRRIYRKTLDAWVYLSQEHRREASEREVADYLAPKLLGLLETETRARRAIADVFDAFYKNRRVDSVGELDDDAEERGGVQVAGDLMDPEGVAIIVTLAKINWDAIRDILDVTASKIGRENTVRLLILQMLLNLKERSQDGISMDYNLRRITTFLNAPEDREINKVWALLVREYRRLPVEIPLSWKDVCHLFRELSMNPAGDLPLTLRETTAWYNWYLERSGWAGSARGRWGMGLDV